MLMRASRWLQRPWSAALLICVLVMRATPAASGAATRRNVQPIVRARAAVVMDVKTGELLYAKSPDQRLPPASTTKVMTAVLALESGRLGEAFVVSQRAAATPAVRHG